LGYQAADWIEARCAIPDGDRVGEPYLLTDEMLRFLLEFFRLNPKTGEFHYVRGGQLIRPQKWGKGPFAAALICAHAAGPVRFSHWDEDGEPVGKAWRTPNIQVTASSEKQADNVWKALLPMIRLGKLGEVVDDAGPGAKAVGETRIKLPSGGEITPTTSSARSRLGAPIVFLLQDEVQSWTTQALRDTADNQRRNIAGMNGRWLATGNAWDPTENSVAQWTAENERDGVYHDDVTPPDSLSIRNKGERRRALKLVYGDSFTGTRDGVKRGVKPWINLDRIDAEIRALLKRDPAQAERYFLNRKEAKEARAFNQSAWAKALKGDYVVPPKALIVIGVDGARFVDSLAIVATEIASGHQFVIGIWERPTNAAEDYEHPLDLVDGAMVDAFDRYEVWRAYIDPGSATGNIEYLVEKWQGRWGEKRIQPFEMYRPRQTAVAVQNYSSAITAGAVSHDGDEKFTEHIHNAVRKKVNVRDDTNPNVWLHTIAKDRPDSPRKIDAAAAAVISWEARGDAIAEDAGNGPSRDVVQHDQREPPGSEYVVRRGDITLRGEHHRDRERGEGRGGPRRGR
jgi:hypothetical protein